MPRRPKRDCDNNPLEKGPIAPDLRMLAVTSIRDFLGSKSSYLGEPIPDWELYTDDNIKTVLRTQNDDKTFEFIHERCLSRIPKNPSYRESTVPWTVHLLLWLLQDMKNLRLPKDFQPGLLLLYFKLCKGISIPPSLLL
jgi:hypothetical protein